MDSLKFAVVSISIIFGVAIGAVTLVVCVLTDWPSVTAFCFAAAGMLWSYDYLSRGIR